MTEGDERGQGWMSDEDKEGEQKDMFISGTGKTRILLTHTLNSS
jgi:hypothetical protein